MGDGTYKILGSVFVFKNEAQIIFLNLFSFFFYFFHRRKTNTSIHTTTHQTYQTKSKKYLYLNWTHRLNLSDYPTFTLTCRIN